VPFIITLPEQECTAERLAAALDRRHVPGRGRTDMELRVLVAYASRHGATAEIAERVGQELNQAGVRTDVRPADEVDDVSSYHAVILGSAVYIGQWCKAAVRFLKAHEQALARRPVWLFSSGPTGEGEPVELMDGWRFPEKLKPLAERIAPRDIAFFHGALDNDKLNFIEKWMIKKVKAPVGDYRDWEAITSWARDIAGVLKGEHAAEETHAPM
jgi:menaquinone-dependent protoporphyrinogen oxidase